MSPLLAPLGRADDAILHWLNSFAGRSELFDRVMLAFVERPMLRFGLFALLFVWLWFRSDKQQAKTRAYVIGAVATAVAAVTVGRTLALALPFRDRPFVRHELGFVMPSGYVPDLRSWSSLPSDHAVLAFALATGLWFISRRLGVAALLYAAFAICFPRMYFGLHHPTDILSGAVVGVAVTLLMQHWNITERVSAWVLRWEVRRPEAFYLAGFLLVSQMTTMFYGLRGLAVEAFRFLRF